MRKILLIDDDVLVLKTIRKLLSLDGYELVESKSAEEALEFVRKEAFDLVITDIRMPGLNGIQMLERLRGDQKNQNLPVILITGYASDEAPLDAFRLSADDYILKPFNSDQLRASVKRVFESSPEERKKRKLFGEFIADAKKLAADFRGQNQRKVFEDEALRAFLDSLEKQIFEVEKKLI